MGSPADTLVAKYPDRVSQLKGPVLAYLSQRSKELRYNGTDQDLYMSVFYPAYRRVPINTPMSATVRRDNPGINTVRDYVAKVNNQQHYPELSEKEWTALKQTASKLGVSWEQLFKLINFESAWKPKARNRISGARGLIQFMPSTAKGMGFKGTMGLGSILLLCGIGYYTVKKLKLI